MHVFAGVPVGPQQPQGRREVVVVGHHRTAVGDPAEVLRRVEAVRGGRRAARGVERAEGLRGVLDDGHAEVGQLGRPPVEVHRDDGPRAVGAAARADSGSRVAVSRSTSTNTGTAPVAHTAAAVGTAVNAGTITSSPGPTPSATQREPQRVGARRHPDRVAPAGERRELALERVELRAEQVRARIARRAPPRR